MHAAAERRDTLGALWGKLAAVEESKRSVLCLWIIHQEAMQHRYFQKVSHSI